jgi:hypothetical protein
MPGSLTSSAFAGQPTFLASNVQPALQKGHLQAAQVERGRVAAGPRNDVRQPPGRADQHRRAVRCQPRNVSCRIPANSLWASTMTGLGARYRLILQGEYGHDKHQHV